MGLFDTTCALSGIVLEGRARLFVLIESAPGALAPALPPLVGDYDRYGKIGDIAAGPVLDATEALAKRSNGNGLASFFDQARDGEAALGPRKLAYALVDDAIYRAVVATQAPDLEAELSAMPLGWLVERAVADPKLAQELFEGSVADPVLRHALVELALFRSFGRELAAHSPDTDGGQFTGFDDVRAYTERAQGELGAHRLLLAAIDDNRQRWVERGTDNAADDDDDDGT